MKKILVPYDFSEYANHALDFACQIAASTGGHITLFHVIENPFGQGINTQGEVTGEDPEIKLYFVKLLEKTEQWLADAIAKDKYKTTEIRRRIEIGTPYKGIGKNIAEWNADLIVMGTKGTSNLEEFFVGSNTEKVVRFSKCPVIAVPATGSLRSVSNIAFATNFESGQSRVIKKLSEYQKLFGAKLHLLWINTIHDTENQDMTLNQLENFAKEHGLENYSTHVSRAVTTEEGILRFVAENNMDMIAMGTHGYQGLSHLFLGSIAEDVVNHAEKPVWTFNMRP